MHHLKFLLFTVLLLVSFNIFPQITIRGTIDDKATRTALPGVSVYIHDLKTGSVTDLEGNYSIAHLSPGTYLFEISFVGYKSIVERFRILGDTILNFTLEESPTELNQVVVTAVTHSTEIKQSPVIIKPVEISELNQNGSTNIIDALKNIPGINQITTGAGISKPVIRGLGYNRVITLYNGIRQEGQQWGDEHGIEIDENAIGKIEIVKGPGSLMFGSDGIAGAINFLSLNAPPEGKTETHISSGYQSNNNLAEISVMHAANKNGLQWSGRFSNTYAGNYRNSYDGKVYNSGFKEYAANVFVGVNKHWGYSNNDLSIFNTSPGIVEGERDSTGDFVFAQPATGDSIRFATATADDLNGYNIGIPYQQVQHFRAVSNNFLMLNTGSIHLDLGFQKNIRREYGDVLHPDEPGLYFDLNTVNFNFRYNLEEYGGWRMTIGSGGMYQSNTNKGSEFIIPGYALFDAGIYVFTQKQIYNKWMLAGGLRYDNRYLVAEELYLDSIGASTHPDDPEATLKFPSFNNSYNSISGSIGATFQPDAVSSFKINISRGFRAPNIAELASNGQHEGTFRYEYGNRDLQAEVSTQLDIAYFLNDDHVTVELTPFINNINNYIFIEKLNSIFGGDSIPDTASLTPAYRFTQGKAQLTGAEIYVDIHPHPLDWLHLENAFSFVNAIQKNQPDTSRYLPNTPAPKYRCVLRAQFKSAGSKLHNVYFKIGLDYYFRQQHYFAAYGTETATPAYTLLSAGMGSDIALFGKKDFLQVYISAENLADIAYQSHLSRLKYAPLNPLTGRQGVYNMGRNISLKILFNI